MQSLLSRLKTETRAIHSQLDGLPFFTALSQGHLPRISIITFLRSLAIIHAVLEKTLTEIESPSIRDWTSPKLQLLADDLKSLGSESVPGISPAVERAIHFGDEILRHGRDLYWLAGLLYVLEGSQNGALTLRQGYARCLGVPAEELSYFGCYGSATKEAWISFSEHLNSLPCSEEQAESVISSAVRSFEVFFDLCAKLYPYSEIDLKHQATGINPEAGSHIVPQDPVEIELALRAGNQARELFPYLEIRFGERGRRFTSSDSCWLLALTELPRESVTKNLVWLRAVLTARGIPSIILEHHLKHISKLLKSEPGADNGRSSQYDSFFAILQAERQPVGENLRVLVEEFEPKLSRCTGLKVPSAAALITSAWLDERAGVTGAYSATLAWFVEPTRFSLDWMANIDALIARMPESNLRHSES